MNSMDNEALRFQILTFLLDFKELMGQGNYYVLQHQKYIDTMCLLGLTNRTRDQIIYDLTIENFVDGPIKDKYREGNLWVFGSNIDGKQLYIKLKIITKENFDEKAVCISFHLAEYPLKYRF